MSKPEFTPPIEIQPQIDALRKLMTTEEPTADNVRTAWVMYQGIVKKIATIPLDRVILAQVNQFVQIMSDLALRGGSVQSNSEISLAVFGFKLNTLGLEKKGGRFFKNLTLEELLKVAAFADKLGSVVTG